LADFCFPPRDFAPLIKGRPVVKELADLKSWPWIALAGFQFWSAKEITLFGRNGAEQTLGISPVLISEGVTSIREAVRAGLGVAVLPDWLIQEDLLFRTTRSRPAAVEGEGFADSRRLCRTTPLARSCERLNRLCGQLHDQRIDAQAIKRTAMKPDGTTVPRSNFPMQEKHSKPLKFANRLTTAG
jgi:DNA-binding transcriptional LysR family regulator